MTQLFKKNIKKLKENFFYIDEMLKTAEKENADRIFLNADGGLCFEKEGRSLRISSSNQLEEAELLLRKIDFDRDNLIVVFGIGNVILLKEIVKRSSNDTRIAVFEPNIEVFKYILNKYELTDLINSERIVFFTGSLEVFEEYMLDYFEGWINLVLNIEVISLINYHAYSEYRYKCINKIADMYRLRMTNMGNSLEDTMIGIDNQYVNAEYCMMSNSINEVAGKYEGYPAIIVASGPSLDKNIGCLKEAEGKALIITCDASYTACVENGVKPQMIASIERGIATYKYYYENQTFSDDIVLIGPSVLRPEIFSKMKGKKIIMSKSWMGVEGWWSSLFDTVEFVDMGHSAATVAFSVAMKAGCSPIILMGQDLAYTDGRIHGSLAHTQYEGENKVKDIKNSLWTKDIYGNTVRTSDIYNTFRYFFEDKIATENARVVDATEGGAYIAGSEIMSLKEAISRFCVKQLPYVPNDLLEVRNITHEYKLKKYNQIVRAVENHIEELKEVQKLAGGYHKKIIHYKNYDFTSISEEELTKIVHVLEKNNEFIRCLYDEHMDLMTYYIQNIRQTIIHVKNLGNKVSQYTVYRNWILQINLIEMIDLASSVVINEFLKIGDFMRKKAEEEQLECLKII